MSGCVYLIGNSTFRWYKIGKSKTPEVRVQDLGVLLPFKIKVFGVWKAHDHTALERLLHEKYKEHRINGEWFEFDGKLVKTFFEFMPEEALVSGFDRFSNIEEDLREGRKVLVRKMRQGGGNLTEEQRKQKRDEGIICQRLKKVLKEDGHDFTKGKIKLFYEENKHQTLEWMQVNAPLFLTK